MRLLLVEDNEELARLLIKGLRAAGYEIDRLAAAAEARLALRTTRYAVLILDLGLPDIEGTEVCGKVSPNAGAQAGRPMKLVADLANMHLIDDSSGKVL